jgi:hypothetical protein
MTFELEGIRPAVLRRETASSLQPVLRFRHFVRHAYAVAWDAERISEVIAGARLAWVDVHADLSAFLRFLKGAAAAMADTSG